MPRNWNSVIDRERSPYIADDCKQAMYQLLVHQCLYLRFRQHAMSYRIISLYRKEYEEAFDLMGLTLRFNEAREFCYVIPTSVKHAPLDTQTTLFLLVLRQIYHLRANVGDLTQDHEAVVGIPELLTVYRSMTGRELDSKTGLIKQLVKSAWQNGLAREIEAPEDVDQQPFAIAILPGIVEVLSEYAVGRFGALLKAGLPIESEVSLAPASPPALVEDES